MNLLYPGGGAVAHDRLTLAAPFGGPIVQLENERLRCSVLPWSGAAIIELTDKASGIDVLCPGVDAIHNIISQPPPLVGGQEYFNRRVGGWPELFPTGGKVDDYLGAPAPFHGESNQRRWDHAIVNAGGAGADLAVARFTLHCMQAPLLLQRDMLLAADSDELLLKETVQNLSDLEIPFMWGHHPTFGKPFLDAGVRIELPRCRFIGGDESKLVCAAEGSKVANMFYATDLAEGRFGLFNPKLGLGAGVRFDPRLFKFLWLWQEFNQNVKPQVFGRWYAAAVEPFTSLPQTTEEFRKAGPMPALAPRQTIQTELTAFFYRQPMNR